jgi:hypothetical protein
MSATHHLPRQNLQSMASLPCPKQSKRSPILRPHIADRILQLLCEIETFLITCTYEEISSFWQALSNLRQHLHRVTRQLEVPYFLDFRRKNRDFCRILEVLADLPYPKMHLSNSLGAKSISRMAG